MTQNWALINAAAERLELNLQADSRFKTLGELLNANSNQPSLSGLQDIDYPNQLNLSHKVPIISNIIKVPLPTEILEQFRNMQHNCSLGIFPEISRAWLTVDSCIFFWAYDNASDVSYYDELDQTILAVHLFKPKPDVFKAHIKYLLCFVTATEVTILGMTCPDEDSVLLLPDPVAKISTDNVDLSISASTSNGRLFLGGNDGCIYEIIYQVESGWFSRNPRKVNHSYSIISSITPTFLSFSEQDPVLQIEIDSARNLLYARTKSSVQLFDLGYDGASIKHVTTKSLSAIVNQASCIANTIDFSNFKPIVSIKAVTKNEANNINLVAVTEAGVRLYFSCNDRPTSLDLSHVRLPPGFTPLYAMQRPSVVSNMYYRDNTFIMSSLHSENKDYLWIMSNDYYVYEDQMMEATSVCSLEGRVWCIAEERKSIARRCPTGMNAPLVVTQHFEERRKFVLITSEGVQIFHKQRPIDQLQFLLMENQGPESPAIRSFIHSTKLTESCLTSLILASSSNLPQEVQLVEWATLAFFRYGGEPKLRKSNGHQNPYLPSMSSPTNFPIQDTSGLMNVSPIASNTPSLGAELEICFSARHDAIYLYLARILRPIWFLKTAATETIGSDYKTLINTATSEETSLYLKRLIELKKFLDLNKQATVGNTNTDAVALERESLSALICVLQRCIEVLNLYKLMLYEPSQLIGNQFSDVCANLPADSQLKLSVMTFKDLIVMGNDMTKNIASALVRRCLKDNRTTDAISRTLHELCPSIYRRENALQAKAHEMILRSREISDKTEKERMINEAVSLLKQIGVRLDLQAACDLLHSARAYKYIVDVCLFVADKRDPLNLAGFQPNRTLNSPLDDNEEWSRATAVSYRVDCYVKIIDTLDRLLNNDEFKEVFDTCVKSTDGLFHTKLYEWLCEKNLSTRLLEVQSPYVESFLKKKAESDSSSTTYLDLMWRFYERRGNFFKAAQILDKLASRSCADYGLEERLEYLSRAKGCIEALFTPGEYLHELEEKMEVIRIQVQIFKKLRELPESPSVLDAISQLNYNLSDLTQLYQNYAQKFNLYDCQLAIIKCGNHYDPVLIEKLWKSIIDEVLLNDSMKSTDTQLQILSNRIENLGKALMPSERFFPAYYIIAYLEYRTHTYGNLGWVPHCLMKIGFKPTNLLDPYHKLYKSREHSVYWSGKPIHVLRVVANMIEESLDKSDRSFATACLDVICDYLIDIQAMSSVDTTIKRLQEKFTHLQSKINQMLN